MMNRSKYFVATILSVVIIVSFAVPAYAADGFGGGSRGDGWDGGGFHTGTVSTYLSYNALSEYCVEQNALISSGVYDSQEPFSSAKQSGLKLSATVHYDSYLSLYLIAVTYQGQWFYLKNDSGAYYCAEYSDAVLLDGIRVHVHNLYDKVSGIYSALTLEGGLFDLWFSLFNARLKILDEHIYGSDDDPEVPSIMSMLDQTIDVSQAVQNAQDKRQDTDDNAVDQTNDHVN